MSCDMCWEMYERFGNEDIAKCILNCQSILANFSPLNALAWRLFNSVKYRRPRDGMSGTVGLLSFSELEAMYRVKEIPPEIQKYLTTRIEILDNIYVNYVHETASNKSKQQQNKSN